ncbi:MAG: fatty acid desaturase [Cocleimonas sp.]|nr:fatty acid desaturase [Cocleimonas sp.]
MPNIYQVTTIPHSDTSYDSARQLRKKIVWQDLIAYQPHETVHELLLPLPWFILALWSSSMVFQGALTWFIVTVIASFYFFLTGLRLAHNAFHYGLGLSKTSTHWVMLILSVLMLGSLHAIQFTHLRHHKHCLGEKDTEGNIAKNPAWLVLLKGPLFPLQIHWVALKKANKQQKKWIKIELFLNGIGISLVCFIWDNNALKTHLILMVVAYCLSAFFAVWTVHHDCENQAEKWDNSRTLRSKWKSYLSYNMFYHIEHHLFPQVPTCHLTELAKRLDQAGYCTHKKVF